MFFWVLLFQVVNLNEVKLIFDGIACRDKIPSLVSISDSAKSSKLISQIPSCFSASAALQMLAVLETILHQCWARCHPWSSPSKYLPCNAPWLDKRTGSQLKNYTSRGFKIRLVLIILSSKFLFSFYPYKTNFIQRILFMGSHDGIRIQRVILVG